MTKVTKLPPGPEPTEPIVGQMYSVYSVEYFCHFIKFPNESWEEGRETDDDFFKLLKAVPHVMLVKYEENEMEGWIAGQILVLDKLLDFWIPIDTPEGADTCKNLWHWHFIPAFKP